MSTTYQEKRKSTLSQLAGETLDLLVIGGGIVGSGVARDAAMRGLRTGLVDRYDFAYGTSSRSSRLLHGGLRYLEQGRVALVHESSVEKKVVHKIAPHLGQPLGFMFPVYKVNGFPLWMMRIGVKMYDLLCNGKNFKPSRGFTVKETLEHLPQINTNELRGSVRYYDALTSDARLTLDTLRSAVKHGAHISNYTRFIDSKRENGIWTCEIEDTLTGEKYTVKTRAILNAAGPWLEKIPHSEIKLRLTKGIHIVVDRKRIHVDEGEAVTMVEGKRILFLIPWGERLIIGTTDTDYDARPEDVKVDLEDIDYVLQTVNTTFPTVKLTREDIISSWVGLRPLIANRDGSPSSTSRAHQIKLVTEGWWDIAGGKLTTYRLMAEQAVTKIVKSLSLNAKPCRTKEEPLLTPEEAATYSGIIPTAYGEAAVKHYVENEWAISLADVIMRRTSWHFYIPDMPSRAEEVGRWMAAAAGWTPERLASELKHYAEEAAKTYPAPKAGA
ncbi:glycerol-3-phosphate dehydrogenase [Ereboglobus sp. PH5-5]|uniref:glycerol-3-phosphate dehydrogenase/oxidase n=1 Tax=unclassified Ereboglobus TaxID=2626932 RepID=UPI00240539D3|nr:MULTISPECIES: glycerol-3-phosphate dehydrogenase/oxidase [unclassified Ereboglobus]MDF9828308.1 glycerol-3-phosphate dehydrogenase [Ereboglobus sp. PH5-10]MDF9834171.1 glycerol-3-phosphate dehydrogenase [Ereboglobus sp. PH5-5]